MISVAFVLVRGLHSERAVMRKAPLGAAEETGEAGKNPRGGQAALNKRSGSARETGPGVSGPTSLNVESDGRLPAGSPLDDGEI